MSRGLGDVYKRQGYRMVSGFLKIDPIVIFPKLMNPMMTTFQCS